MKFEPATVADLVDRDATLQSHWPEVSSEASLREAARALAGSGAEAAVVVENGNQVGAVFARSLLLALAADTDPVTLLPRSGPLRDWLGEQLRDGREVAILFFDLDRFGEVNKQHGHTEGDAALRRAAVALAEAAGQEEFACRFGGDEFAIGTLRTRVEAVALAERIGELLRQAGVPGTFGVSGGRRANVRDDAHVNATVEELLRLASLECLSRKPG